jgi:UDP-N-acetylglucosamine/UDP-N-acetylgalactosamine diphosphorylase
MIGNRVVFIVLSSIQVVEYSEILPATAQKTDANGTLLFSAGNICNHFFTVDFLDHVASDENEDLLPYHPATKKIPCIDPDQGVPVKPTTPNGIKLEKFVFDVFAFSKNFRLWEVRTNHQRTKKFQIVDVLISLKKSGSRFQIQKLVFIYAH